MLRFAKTIGVWTIDVTNSIKIFNAISIGTVAALTLLIVHNLTLCRTCCPV